MEKDKMPNINTNINTKINTKINDFYENASYYQLFNIDIWITIIVFIIVFLIVLYYTIKSQIRSYKADWEQNKCNPVLMPFASIINPELDNGTGYSYTLDNFTDCLNILNAELATDMTKPINKIKDNLGDFYSTLNTIVETTQGYLIALFNLIIMFFSLFVEKITNFILHTQLVFITINDFFAKLLSVLTVIYYTIILLISTYKLIFIVAVMGFLMVFVIPAGAIVTAQLILLVTGIIKLAFFTPLLPFSLGFWIAMLILVIVSTVIFIISLIFFIILLVFYTLLSTFVDGIGLPTPGV